MKFAPRGKSTSVVEVVNVSKHGFWLALSGQELFLSFEDFPWFRNAAIGDLTTVTLVSKDHLYWPKLDVDLSVESIRHPEMFPLVSEPKTDYRESAPSKPRAAVRKKAKPTS